MRRPVVPVGEPALLRIDRRLDRLVIAGPFGGAIAGKRQARIEAGWTHWIQAREPVADVAALVRVDRVERHGNAADIALEFTDVLGAIDAGHTRDRGKFRLPE